MHAALKCQATHWYQTDRQDTPHPHFSKYLVALHLPPSPLPRKTRKTQILK